MKTFVTFVILACLSICAVPALGAQDSTSLAGTWYRFLPVQKQQVNGHYRLELISIEPLDNSSGRMIRVEIYPETGLRTRIRMGTYAVLKEGAVPLELRFLVEGTFLARVHAVPEGFPVSTYLDVTGPGLGGGSESVRITPLLHDGVTEGIRVGQVAYRSLQAEMERLSQGFGAQDAQDFLRLLFIHIYTSESRVKEFGTISMVGMHLGLPGMTGGVLQIEFQSRGFLGLGNSGVMFYIQDALEFPRLLVRGEVFGGVYAMEGKISIYLQKPTGLSYLGSMDCTQVKLKDGVCNAGNFLVELASHPGTWIPVPFTAIAQ